VSPIDFVGELFYFCLDDVSNVAKTFLNQNGFNYNRDKILAKILSFLVFSEGHFRNSVALYPHLNNTFLMKKILSIAFVICAATAQMFAQAKPADYAGTFKLSENPYVKTVTISVKDSKVIMSAEGFPDAELAPGKNADEFALESMGGTVAFVREAGAVKGIKIEAQGQVLTGQKEGDSALGDYVATFKMADNEYVKKIVIAMKDGQLALSSDANPAEGAILKPSNEKDTFSATIQGYDADVIFSRAAGKVTTIKLSVAGGQVVLTGDRE
jgi:hypothetical protein